LGFFFSEFLFFSIIQQRTWNLSEFPYFIKNIYDCIFHARAMTIKEALSNVIIGNRKQCFEGYVLCGSFYPNLTSGPLWWWLYGSWIYNYIWNQCLSPLTLWVRLLLRRGVLDTTLSDKVCQWLATGQWFFQVLRFPPPIKLTATIL
jgi:hypothetical protein